MSTVHAGLLARTQRSPDADREAGFSLVEVLVAMLIFACVAGAMTNLILRTIDESFSNKARVTATNLAERELELLRQYDQSQLAATGNMRRDPVVINNTTYNVDLVARWVPAAIDGDKPDNASKCSYKLSAARPQAYVRADVTVSWGGVSNGSVTSSTLIQPAKSINLTGSGMAIADISRANGSIPASQKVTIVGGSPSTTRSTYSDVNGCAFFSYLPFGTYTFTVGDATLGQPVVTQSANVNSSTYGSITPVNYNY